MRVQLEALSRSLCMEVVKWRKRVGVSGDSKAKFQTMFLGPNGSTMDGYPHGG